MSTISEILSARNTKLSFPRVWKRRAAAVMRRGTRGLLAACLTLSMMAITPVQPVSAADSPAYYVALSGNDTTGNGSAASPWRTIQKAASTIPAGATVHVAPGTYNERVSIAAAKSGSASARTAIVADGAVIVAQGFVVSSSYTDLTGFEVTPGGASVNYDAGQVDIYGDYNVVSGFNVHHTVNGSAFAFRNGASYNTVKDFTVERSYYDGGWFYINSDHNTMLNGTIHDFGGMEGVYMLGTNNTVDGATVTGPGGWTKIWSYFGDGDGIRPWGTNLTIRNCRIYDIWPGSPEAHSDAIQFWRGQTNLLVENNVFGSWGTGGINNTRDADAGIMMSAAEDVSITVRNNVFLGGMYHPINMNTGGAGRLTIQLYNNTFWTNGPPRLEKMPASVIRNNIFKAGISILNPSTSPGLTSDYNLYLTAAKKPAAETHSIVGDPQFVNPDISAATHYGVNANFRLKATSPAIGAAVAGYAPGLDFTGAARDARPDIGAFEYPAAGASTPVLPPGPVTVPLGAATLGVTVPTVSLGASPSTATWGTYVTLRARYLLGSAALRAAAPVTVWSTASGTWRQVGVATYNSASKTYSFRARMTKGVSFQMRYTEPSRVGGAVAGGSNVRTTLSRVISVRARPKFASTRVPAVTRRYRAFTATSYLSPKQSSARYLRFRCYRFERQHNGSYKWILRKIVTPRVTSFSSVTTRMSASFSLRLRGKWKVVPYYSGTTALAAAYGATDYITVK